MVKRGPAERFWAKVDKSGDCWLWTGYKEKRGYGVFMLNVEPKRSCLAHRYSYALTNGEIPEGLTIDHLCRTKHCVNPAHLEAVTIQENIRRNPNNSIHDTQCRYGHDYFPDNFYLRPNGARVCRTCEAARSLKRVATARLLKGKRDEELENLRAEVARLKDEMVEACDSHCRRELCVMQREIDAAESRLTALRLHYSEAIEDIEEWGGYASSYFQNKHDLEGAVANHRAALAKSGTPQFDAEKQAREAAEARLRELREALTTIKAIVSDKFLHKHEKLEVIESRCDISLCNEALAKSGEP